MDPRQEVVTEVDSLVSLSTKKKLKPVQCQKLVDLSAVVPGRIRPIVAALSCQRTPASVDALVQLPASLPGVVEGVYQALAHGVVRKQPKNKAPLATLAVDFKSSRARNFPEIIARARTVFQGSFEELSIDKKMHYRFSLQEGQGTLAGRASTLSQDLYWLHSKLHKLKGTRLWLNGWCFESDSPLGPAVQEHFVRAWMSWAAKQTQTHVPSRQ